MKLVLFIFPFMAQGALTVTFGGSTQTQAILIEKGFSGPCTIVVSPSSSFSPTIPDFNGTEYSGSSTDTGRADTITSNDGLTRTIFVGHVADGDRALFNWTTYYYQVSGCGTTQTGNFTTANLSSGTTRTEQTPFNNSRWGNLGLPQFDWTNPSATYVDPLTGAKIAPMTTTQLTWRTGGGASGPTSSVNSFVDWAGGSGWTNPSTVLSGSGTTATTNNQNPVDLYADLNNGSDPTAYIYPRTLEDVGVTVWGKVPGCTGADCVVNVCIILNPVAGCASNVIPVTLSSGGTTVQTLSGSSDPNQPFPVAFPTTPFFGWTGSVSPLIHQENQENFGTLSATGTALTISSPGPNNSFSSALTTGGKIFIAGSSGTCTNSLCTLASPPNAGAATIVENLGAFGSASFRAYPWGIRVQKATSSGTATIGLNYKLAGSLIPLGTTTCSDVQVTSGDGKNGYLCQIEGFQPGFGFLAFIATDGTTRLLSRKFGVGFDSIAGNIAYQGVANGSGGWTINKLVYGGDYTTNLLPNDYGCSNSLNCPAFSDGFTVIDLMPNGSNLDLNQQIATHQGGSLPAYNFSLYGSWLQANPQVNQYGSSGHFFYFANIYSGQGQINGGGPGWIAVVDVSTNPAVVTRLIHTLDGTGFANARFGSIHSPQVVKGKINTLFISVDQLYANSTSVLFGGPFEAPVQDVQVSDAPVVWSGHAGGATAGTCVSGSLGTSNCATGYFTGCSTLIFVCNSSLWPTGNGVVYTQLLTLRFLNGGPCSTKATAAEVALAACPWNGAFGHYPIVQPGDNAYDDITGLGNNFDNEHFRVLEVVNGGSGCGAGMTCYLVARNSVPVYCGRAGQLWQGQANPDAIGADTNFNHANGWTFVMGTATWDTCQAGVLFQDQTDLTHPQELGRTWAIHFATGVGATGGVNFVTTTAAMQDVPFTHLQDVPEHFSVLGAQWNGVDAGITPAQDIQSYTDDSQTTAGPKGVLWGIDTNPAVNCTFEQLGCPLENKLRTLTNITGDVYKIQSIGNASASLATYKSQPMIGFAGRYVLKDVSGIGSSVDSTPWSMCFTIIAGECHAGSVANEIYVNVPQAYDPAPGYCTASVNWANIPCVLFGNNAPGSGTRRYKINVDDTLGAYSQMVTNGWGSYGRQYPIITKSISYPNGQWLMQGGTQLIDGLSVGSQMISLPEWREKRTSANGFQTAPVSVPSGNAFAQVQFGYSRYLGATGTPTMAYLCTARQESCDTRTTGGSVYSFQAETATGLACTSGCTIPVPVVSGNILYYKIRTSPDNVTWTDLGDTQVIAVP